MKILRLVLLLVLLAPATASAATAPGAPGQTEPWAQADKDGFGTSATRQSKVWHTLDDGALTEVYYPDLGTPAVRDLQFAVSDGRTFAERERENTSHRIALTDRRSLTYRQVNSTDRYRITKTYVTDPARNALEIKVRLKSLTGRKLSLYEIATALLAAGDRAGARRALTFLLSKQQNDDGCFPQNSTVDGADHWLNLQLDEAAFPIVLAWQLHRTDAETYTHVKLAAACILAHGPKTQQERWENQEGWSPATIAAEIAGLVTGAQIARANGDTATAAAWEATADEWQRKVDGWTYTTTGPYGDGYYLRLTKDGNANAGTTYDIGDSGPTGVDQRKVVDPSYLELVRLGVKRADDPHILSTLPIVDRQLAVETPNGTFWHRFSFDGYGEQKDGSEWNLGFPTNPTENWENNVTIGRIWPIFAGERGEYELAAGETASARTRLAAMARAGGEGHMIPEQVWDDFAPSGSPGFPKGEATLSASPLAWSHAQFVRLAWSIDAGRPIERPAVVACRYAGCG